MNITKSGLRRPLCRLTISLTFHGTEIETNVPDGTFQSVADGMRPGGIEGLLNFYSLNSFMRGISNDASVYSRWAPPNIIESGSCKSCGLDERRWEIGSVTFGEWELWLKHHEPLFTVLELYDKGELTVMKIIVQARVINSTIGFHND